MRAGWSLAICYAWLPPLQNNTLSGSKISAANLRQNCHRNYT
jgi:hypothetical protein